MLSGSDHQVPHCSIAEVVVSPDSTCHYAAIQHRPPNASTGIGDRRASNGRFSGPSECLTQIGDSAGRLWPGLCRTSPSARRGRTGLAALTTLPRRGSPQQRKPSQQSVDSACWTPLDSSRLYQALRPQVAQAHDPPRTATLQGWPDCTGQCQVVTVHRSKIRPPAGPVGLEVPRYSEAGT